MDFLTEYGAIIYLPELLVTFSRIAGSRGGKSHKVALRVCDDSVNVPPRSSVLVTVVSDSDRVGLGIVESSASIIFSRQVCVARGLLELTKQPSEILLTNFSREYQHFTKKRCCRSPRKSTTREPAYQSQNFQPSHMQTSSRMFNWISTLHYQLRSKRVFALFCFPLETALPRRRRSSRHPLPSTGLLLNPPRDPSDSTPTVCLEWSKTPFANKLNKCLLTTSFSHLRVPGRLQLC